MAEAVIDGLPGIAGAFALDVGAGTGAATVALQRAGAHVVATDLAPGMLSVDQSDRPPCCVADVQALPFRDDTFDVVIAAFVLNHLTEPARGLREMGRVTRRGGRAVATAYAAVDDHPVKAAVHDAAGELGWQPQEWMRDLRNRAMPLLATIDGAQRVLAASDVTGVVEERSLALPDLDPIALIEWRLGMADMTPFVATLDPPGRVALRSCALQRLGTRCPTLVRTMIVITLTV